MREKPIAVTTGEPAGIGPEVALKAAVAADYPIVLLGDRTLLDATRKKLGLPTLPANVAVEDVMKRLKPGEISDPVRTQYGYHLIQVVERREQKADAKRSRLAAQQALREKKLTEAVATWQRELHDQAYVEIRRENL